ncbi:hypothetical protein EYF80_058963 [Liparis tanakae]|uniref:Uncharacterized protein n=1 Tax=Liparis tanakae TaxID=230148 RepID=A0A4Z2EPK7_9TELE|nr:hypothetical protein EYF80_058963 [Liparis tanakae]
MLNVGKLQSECADCVWDADAAGALIRGFLSASSSEHPARPTPSSCGCRAPLHGASSSPQKKPPPLREEVHVLRGRKSTRGERSVCCKPSTPIGPRALGTQLDTPGSHRERVVNPRMGPLSLPSGGHLSPGRSA